MGYNNYKEYVAGVVWANIRDKVFEEKGGKCIICTRKATVIHHRLYSKEVLEGTNIIPLEPLCWDCHNRIEYGVNGEKLPLDHANSKLDWYIKNKCRLSRNPYSSLNIGVVKERRYTSYPLTKL